MTLSSKAPSLNSHEKDALLNDLAFHRFILGSLPIAVFTVDSELKITSFNPWAEKATGYSAQRVLGRFCGEILRGGMCHRHCPLRISITSRVPHENP